LPYPTVDRSGRSERGHAGTIKRATEHSHRHSPMVAPVCRENQRAVENLSTFGTQWSGCHKYSSAKAMYCSAIEAVPGWKVKSSAELNSDKAVAPKDGHQPPAVEAAPYTGTLNNSSNRTLAV